MPSLEPRLSPFWSTRLLHQEPLFFLGPFEEASTASLLFPPVDVMSVTSATHEAAYESGRDFTIDMQAGRITRLAGSRMPCTRRDELRALTCAADDAFHRRQVVATYAHAGGWPGLVPASAAAAMPETFRRLRGGEPIAIAVTGDSISEGYNASAFIQSPPFQPAYPSLAASGLAAMYRSPIDLQNLAVAGWTSDDGLADAERLTAAEPHLVVIAYGMNDSTYAEPEYFAGNVQGIVVALRHVSPRTEFVLVSPMMPIAAADAPETTRIPAYRDALARLTGPGIVLADLTAMWLDLLRRKSEYDLSGNGFNHPNDFGHRVYAQVILALLGGEGPTVAHEFARSPE